MSGHTALTPAQTLAENCNVRIVNESAEYRRARTALLAEEIELRRHIERVAEMRRALPPGGEAKNYRFVGEQGPVDFADLFGDKQTLVIYTYMYGPQRQRPCPMCTSLLSAWDGEARGHHAARRAGRHRALADRASARLQERARLARPQALFRSDRRLQPRLPRRRADGNDWGGLHVFSRRDGTIRHFWSGEMDVCTADPGQDPRGAPDLMPLWTVLDTTPEGRDPHWYPKLDYGR